MLYDFYYYSSMVLMCLMVLFSIAMIIIVLLQKGNESNLGAIAGGAESFFGKEKAKTWDGKFKKLTVIIAILLVVTSIVFFVFQLMPGVTA